MRLLLQYCMQLMPMPVTTLLAPNGTPSNPTRVQSTKMKSTKLKSVMLRASCLTINEFWCYEARIEKSEMAGSCRKLNPGLFWLEPPVLYHWATTAKQPPILTILYMYCMGSTDYPSRTPGSHSVCAVRTLLRVNWRIIFIRKELILSGFLTLNSQSILPHAGNKWV